MAVAGGGAVEVYPRVCGGSTDGRPRLFPSAGLSPRVRGKLLLVYDDGAGNGSIPACAGEALGFPVRLRLPQVYPRVCGGSPHRGVGQAVKAGLSPRVRGKRLFPVIDAQQQGSIPACAGEAKQTVLCRRHGGVYPRVCGGSRLSPAAAISLAGLSPRVRGKPLPTGRACPSSGSIPACAGEARPYPPLNTAARVYPRVCGGSALPIGHRPARPGLSPRVRGKPADARLDCCRQRSIPACAGEA